METEDWIVDCTNGECEWTGLESQCVHPEGFEGSLCPICFSIVEPVADHED